MLITRLYLRNFRVFEEELDLPLPPGLVGIHGPNGAGKSTLLEAILFTLWGKSRTSKEQVRSSGTNGDCLTEVEFEHEGHLYMVRRTLKGANSAVSVEAHCDGALMSTGVRDAERYVQSVLGMDDSAFRASVFTEQKHLAAFSDHSPAERRKLVMKLLGVTPLDAARDNARRDARDLTGDHDRLRGMLADLVTLETRVSDATAAADAAEAQSADEHRAAQAAEERAGEARRQFELLDGRRLEHETLVVEGRSVRETADRLTKAVEVRRKELGELGTLEAEITRLAPATSGASEIEACGQLLFAVRTARLELDACRIGDEPPVPDATESESASALAAKLREDLAASRALTASADAELKRSQAALERSAKLTGEADCPVCGQSLGDAFETVQAHRQSELSAAETRAADSAGDLRRIQRAARDAENRAGEVSSGLAAALEARARWERDAERKVDANRKLDKAWQAAVDGGAGSGPAPGASALQEAIVSTQDRLKSLREAEARVQHIQGRLERRPSLQRDLDEELAELATTNGRLEALREKVRSLSFDPDRLSAVRQARDNAEAAAREVTARAHMASVTAATEREKARSAGEAVEAAREQHAQLADLETKARHVSRAAELLADFRDTVVATVGPRLALEAADLFADLTDHEYERLEVDPSNYEIQIRDGGRSFGLDRFSGSEVDLANLALRVAISEHIHFQSGGSVGLLVLDEVFGPLDEDRKARMLLALERLRGRFRQVLVVTHDSDIKDQLPAAVEVVKLPGRRATARVVGD